MAPVHALIAGVGFGMVVMSIVEPIMEYRSYLEGKARWQENEKQEAEAELKAKARLEELKREMAEDALKAQKRLEAIV